MGFNSGFKVLMYLYLTLPFYICDIKCHHLFSFVEYLPEEGQKSPKHAGGLPHVCILLHRILLQLLEYIC